VDFVKMQATGNDFVLIDARGLELDWPELSRAMCDRHFGVGADGALLYTRSGAGDLHLRMFNPDGSEAEACGNGLRCFARHAVETGLASGPEVTILTMAGPRLASVSADRMISVAMGAPELRPSAIPVLLRRDDRAEAGPVIDYPLTVDGTDLRVTCVSIGNPHAVHFTEQPVTGFPLDSIGPTLEHHAMFPQRVNFEVANVITKNSIKARVWERGARETLSCGTGACAIAVASRLKGLAESPVTIDLPGGTVEVQWDGRGEVLLSGPAEVVFKGEWRS
jgi:diaminopimelate epimerase